ncbi:MAG: hypothetical protein IT385_04645 [Deltaproteobacteria bacterium]|nr:hypothetical protein [Deltaproteobacteria bacterium]
MRLASLCVLVPVLAACGDDASTTDTSTSTTDTATSTDTSTSTTDASTSTTDTTTGTEPTDATGTSETVDDTGQPGDTTGSGTPISAASGGVVASDDGVFALHIPAGALDADTTFTVTRLAPGTIPDAFGDAYRVEPSGTTFDPPAMATWEYASAPDDLTFGLVEVMIGDGSGSEPSTLSGVFHGPGGAVGVLGEVPHLSSFWAVESIGSLAVDVEALPGDAPASAHIGAVVRRASLPNPHVLETFTRVVGTDRPDVLRATPMAWPRDSGLERLLSMPGAPAPLSHLGDSPTMRQGPPITGTPESEEVAWVCDGEGTAHGVELIVKEQTNAMQIGGVVFEATCTAPVIGEGEALLANECEAIAFGDGVACTPLAQPAQGLIVNLTRPPEGESPYTCSEDRRTCTYEDVEVFECASAGPVIFETALQEITATHDGTLFGYTGASAGAAFNPFSLDELTLRMPDANVSVPAPHAVDATSLLGDGSGLGREVSVYDQTDFDAIYVYGAGDGGKSGIVRTIPRYEMVKKGDYLTAPLLTAGTIDDLATRGITLDTVTLGPIKEAFDDTLFPGTGLLPIRAGRLVTMPVEALTRPEGDDCRPADGALGTGGSASLQACWGGPSRGCALYPAGCGAFTRLGTFRLLDPQGLTFERATDPKPAIVSSTAGTIEDQGIYNRITGLPTDGSWEMRLRVATTGTEEVVVKVVAATDAGKTTLTIEIAPAP